MAGTVLNVNVMYVQEALLQNHLDGFCHCPAAQLDDRVFVATDGAGMPPLLPPEYCPHTVGSTAYSGSVSG